MDEIRDLIDQINTALKIYNSTASDSVKYKMVRKLELEDKAEEAGFALSLRAAGGYGDSYETINEYNRTALEDFKYEFGDLLEE